MSGVIVAMGGGGFATQPDDPRLDAFILSLARRPRPRVCFVGTAGGDDPHFLARFYRAMAEHDWRPDDLGLFERRVGDLRGFVLEQDVIYVGGGNTASLLAVWRAHGLDAVLHEAWEAGVVMCGVSAGMNCWFEASVTDSFGPGVAPLHDGLGLLRGSACPHFDGEPLRRPAYLQLVADGFPPGYAADDVAALVFQGGELSEVLTTSEGSTAYRVEVEGERALKARVL